MRGDNPLIPERLSRKHRSGDSWRTFTAAIRVLSSWGTTIWIPRRLVRALRMSPVSTPIYSREYYKSSPIGEDFVLFGEVQ